MAYFNDKDYQPGVFEFAENPVVPDTIFP